MMYANACGGYADQECLMISNKDRIALLKEKEAILEAKLATIRYWIETAEKAESASDKQ